MRPFFNLNLSTYSSKYIGITSFFSSLCIDRHFFVLFSGVKSEPKTVFLEPKPVPHLQHLHNHCNNDVNSNVSMENNNSMPDHPDTDVDTKDPLCGDTVSATTPSALNESQHPTPVDFYP